MNEATLVLREQTQRGTIWGLALAKALAGANSEVIYATGAVVGNDLAPYKMLATLSITDIAGHSVNIRLFHHLQAVFAYE